MAIASSIQRGDPLLGCPELGLLFGRQTIDLATANATLAAPVVDRLIADVQIVRDAGHASSLGEQIENLRGNSAE